MNIQEVFGSVGAALRADFDGMSGQIGHSGVKGAAREEALMTRYLSKYLPRTVQALQTAEVVATTGAVSKECDIVLVDPRTPPFIDGDGYHVVPAECLYAVIEVKSMLDQKELEDAYTKIKIAKSLPKTAFFPQDVIEHSTTVYGRTYSYFPTAGYVFAYDSIDLRTLSERLRQLQSASGPEEWIDGVFVLNKGLIAYWSDEKHATVSCAGLNVRAVAFASDDTLLAATLLLNLHLEGVWMPHFKLLDYVDPQLKMAIALEP